MIPFESQTQVRSRCNSLSNLIVWWCFDFKEWNSDISGDHQISKNFAHSLLRVIIRLAPVKQYLLCICFNQDVHLVPSPVTGAHRVCHTLVFSPQHVTHILWLKKCNSSNGKIVMQRAAVSCSWLCE